MLLIATPLATGLTVLATPMAAYAISGEITSPADGAVITSGTQATARASFEGMILGVKLRLSGPEGDQVLGDGKFDGQISRTFSIRRNGKYTLRLVGTTGTTYDTNTFQVRVPPATPSGAAAKLSGSTLTVTWNLGLEDDISGYFVTASGGLGSKSGTPGQMCVGTVCSAKFGVGSMDARSVTVSIRARRPDGVGGSLSSGSATTSVRLPGEGAGNNGREGDDGDSGGGGDTGGNSTLPMPDYNYNGRDSGMPLTPFNDESPITLPSVQPEGATPGFTYPAPMVAGQNAGGPGPAITGLQWGKSVATALVLLLIAAHLGTWTRRMRVAQAGISSRGMAARAARSGSGRARVKRAQERIARAQSSARAAKVKASARTRRRSGGGRHSAAALKPAAVTKDRLVAPRGTKTEAATRGVKTGSSSTRGPGAA